MVPDPTRPLESAHMAAAVHLQAMTTFHAARHDCLLKQQGGYEQALFHRLMMEVAYLGKKRIDLLAEADRVMRTATKRKRRR